MKTVLFISHKKSQCGVYVPSLYITDAIQYSKKYNFVRVECESLDELKMAIVTCSPSAIIYNYMPILFPFMADGTYRLAPMFAGITQIGIIHDVSQGMAEGVRAYKDGFVPGVSSSITAMFDYYIALDPTIGVVSPIVQGIGRLIPTYQNNFPKPDKLTVGSYGFGTPGKGFDRLVPLVESEFDEAVIRINIPASTFCDPTGTQAGAIATHCHAQVTKPGIQLITTHNYWGEVEVMDFLAQSTVNVFLYEDMGVRGIASVLDMAIAVKRPIALSDSVMYRHVLDAVPSICVLKNDPGSSVPQTTLRAVVENGFAPLQGHYDKWTTANYIRSYEEIVDAAFANQQEAT